MSVQVEWDNEARTIILWTFVGRWTWGEYDEAREQAIAMIQTGDQPVDFLYDVRQMSIIPADLITRFKARYLDRPKSARLYLVVGTDEYLQILWNTFTRLPYASHLKVHYFDTLEEARQFSEQHKSETE